MFEHCHLVQSWSNKDLPIYCRVDRQSPYIYITKSGGEIIIGVDFLVWCLYGKTDGVLIVSYAGLAINQYERMTRRRSCGGRDAENRKGFHSPYMYVYVITLSFLFPALARPRVSPALQTKTFSLFRLKRFCSE